MKLLTLATTLALAMTLAFPGAVAEPNPEQSGTNSACLDYNVLYDTPLRSPIANIVAVEAGSVFQIGHDGGAEANVDFFDSSGTWITYNAGAATGVVPAGSAYGVICVSQMFGWPSPPAPLASWTYQDGF